MRCIRKFLEFRPRHRDTFENSLDSNLDTRCSRNIHGFKSRKRDNIRTFHGFEHKQRSVVGKSMGSDLDNAIYSTFPLQIQTQTTRFIRTFLGFKLRQRGTLSVQCSVIWFVVRYLTLHDWIQYYVTRHTKQCNAELYVTVQYRTTLSRSSSTAQYRAIHYKLRLQWGKLWCVV